MSMRVKDVRAWLATLKATDFIGIDEDGFNLRLADERYDDECYLEIGMALSSDYMRRIGHKNAPEEETA